MEATPEQTIPIRQLRVFLCHSSGDKPAVRELYRRLKADGFAPWLDEEDLIPGQGWQQEIPAVIRACDVFVTCLSQKSVNKEGFLQKEIQAALSVAEEKPPGTIFIIPIKLEEVVVPEHLSQWQWANLFQEDGYQRLVRALEIRAGAIGGIVATSAAGKPGEDERLVPEPGAPPQGSSPTEAAILPPTVPKPPPTLIVSPPTLEVSQSPPSTKVVQPPKKKQKRKKKRKKKKLPSPESKPEERVNPNRTVLPASSAEVSQPLPSTKVVVLPVVPEVNTPMPLSVRRKQIVEQTKDYHIECAQSRFGVPLPPPSLPPFFSGPHNEFEDAETCGICNKPIKRDETVVTGPSVDGGQ